MQAQGFALSGARGGGTNAAMSQARILRFYLDPGLKRSAEDGRHNFIAQVADVARGAGFRVEFKPSTATERMKSATRRGYSMFHMDEPYHERALTMRRVYHYPFWAIEQSARRWEWRVARARFDAGQVDRDAADKFARYWRKRLFGKAAPVEAGGFVYVPLQGRLSVQRSFQTCTPLEMVEQTLARTDTRPVIAALHPGETYAPNEIAALERLCADHPRLELRTGGMEGLLPACDMVVTQNSAAAFNGFFFDKPAILFGRVDFHHIAANVADLGVEGAFDAIVGARPDFAGYIWWFWQVMAINAGRPEAPEKIAKAMREAGWPV